ncbi:protein CASC4-like isoform X2 [Scleropages formosus]|uniref:protein CASC4-like isoform X2 n=1 Tax=Scleropages formosus TaxID=113540 RepID=UPI0010FA8B21|nr:protein CASC4-like isoform X2 [Scleropages formosus]
MLGFNGGRRGLRFPPFVALALAALVLFLSFNCWDLSRKRARLLDELAEAQAQARRTDSARGRLEKRNAELVAQVDTQRKEADKRQSDYEGVRENVRALEAQNKKCADEKMKIQSESQAHISEIQRLKEQLKELRDEFMKQESQLHEMKKNTTLQKKLEYESSQCKQQIIQLQQVHMEQKKSLEEELVKLKKNLLDNQGVAAVGGHPEDARNQQNVPNVKESDRLVRDTGMLGIEDNGVGKLEDVQFALKKPAITQMQFQGHGAVMVQKPGADVPGHGIDLPRDPLSAQKGKGILHPTVDTKLEKGAGNGGDHEGQLLQQHQLVLDNKPILGIKKDAYVEQQEEEHGQIKAPDSVKTGGMEVKHEGHQPALKPIQVLAKPMEKDVNKNLHPAEFPQHGQNEDQKAMKNGAEMKRHQAMDML